MSCLLEFKVINILGDKTDDFICDHLMERNASFLGMMKREFLTIINRATRKYLFREVL